MIKTTQAYEESKKNLFNQVESVDDAIRLARRLEELEIGKYIPPWDHLHACGPRHKIPLRFGPLINLTMDGEPHQVCIVMARHQGEVVLMSLFWMKDRG